MTTPKQTKPSKQGSRIKEIHDKFQTALEHAFAELQNEEAPKGLKKLFFRTARKVGKEVRVHIKKQEKKAAKREKQELKKAFNKGQSKT